MTQLNPVVQKIAEQAKGFVDLNQHVGGGNGCMIYTYEGLNKFAELIVRECIEQIQICSEQIKNDDGYADDNICPLIPSIVDALAIDDKERYGVE